MVFRLYVEKKRGLEAEAKKLLGLIRNYTALEPETELRLFDRYDFDGITSEEFEIICKKIIVDENSEVSFIDYLPLTNQWRSIAVSPIEGKYIQKIEGIRNCAKAYGINSNYAIRYAKIIALSNLLNDYKLNEISKLLIDERIYTLSDSTKSLSIEDKSIDFGSSVVDEDFLEKNDIQIYQYLNKTSLNMTKDMLCLIRDYFKLLKRNPTLIELHCIDSYLASKNTPENYRFREINFEDIESITPLKITLEEFINMREQARIDKIGTISLKDIAMAGYDYMKQKGQIQDIVIEKGQHLIQVPVDVNSVVEQYLISFKAGKTNKNDGFDVSVHQSLETLEAYQSLDIDCRPYYDKKDKNYSTFDYSNSVVADDVTDKIAKYNKSLGIATALGGQTYSKSTVKPVNFSACAFSGTKSDFTSKISNGDLIVMLGSKFTVNDLYSKDFIQKNNTILKEKISQFFKQASNSTFIKKTLDFSLGIVPGILDCFSGVEIDINRIVAPKNLKYSHLAVSAKSCRSGIVVSKENVEHVKEICVLLGLSSHIIGEINDEPFLVIKNGKKQVANISTEFITGLRYNNKHNVLIKDLSNKKVLLESSPNEYEKLSTKEAFIQNLRNISVSSKKGIASKFDSTVGGGCVLAPYGGKNEITPSDAFVCKIPTKTGNTNTATAISYGYNPRMSKISPYHGAAFSIMECISKIVATGSNSINTKLAICQSLSDPKEFESKYSDLFSAAFGAFATESGMNIPAISYDLSFDKNDENSFDFSCFAIAVSKSNEIISQDFKSSNSTVILVPMPIVEKTGLPDYDRAKVIYRQIHYLSQNGKVLSAGVVNEGGIAALVAKMSFGNGIGVEFINLDKDTLFSVKTASIVIETKNPGAFSGMDTIIIGKTIKEPKFIFDTESVALNEALNVYTGSMQNVYPTRTAKKTAMAKIEPYTVESRPACSNKVSSPKVVIPVFTSFAGANDCKRSFENAGGDVDIVAVSPKDFKNSLSRLSQNIENSQIICLPSGGGNSFSTEFGYSVFTNPIITESIIKFLNRDGLIIGFEEGFDILLKSGLLTSGVYKSLETGAYLTQSVTAMTSSGFVRTKVISDKSPWMSLCKTNDIYCTAIHHNKSRFVADEVTMLSLINNHQITTQYIDKNLKPAAKMPFNPDGSICAVESICSPDGKILGKTSLPQRRTRGSFINISDNKDMRLFEAGIKYFKE